MESILRPSDKFKKLVYSMGTKIGFRLDINILKLAFCVSTDISCIGPVDCLHDCTSCENPIQFVKLNPNIRNVKVAISVFYYKYMAEIQYAHALNFFLPPMPVLLFGWNNESHDFLHELQKKNGSFYCVPPDQISEIKELYTAFAQGIKELSFKTFRFFSLVPVCLLDFDCSNVVRIIKSDDAVFNETELRYNEWDLCVRSTIEMLFKGMPISLSTDSEKSKIETSISEQITQKPRFNLYEESLNSIDKRRKKDDISKLYFDFNKETKLNVFNVPDSVDFYLIKDIFSCCGELIRFEEPKDKSFSEYL